jgi:hypothetical protein
MPGSRPQAGGRALHCPRRRPDARIRRRRVLVRSGENQRASRSVASAQGRRRLVSRTARAEEESGAISPPRVGTVGARRGGSGAFDGSAPSGRTVGPPRSAIGEPQFCRRPAGRPASALVARDPGSVDGAGPGRSGEIPPATVGIEPGVAMRPRPCQVRSGRRPSRGKPEGSRGQELRLGGSGRIAAT